MKTKSKYENEMIHNTGLLHSVIMNENDKYGYKDKLIKLFNSYTFSRYDFIAVIYSICAAHNIDITRIDVEHIINSIGKQAKK